MQQAHLEKVPLIDFLRQSEFVYMVLEPSAWPHLTPLLLHTKTPYAVLYEGMPPQQLLPHLPRLVRVCCSSDVLATFVDENEEGRAIYILPVDGNMDLGTMASHVAPLCNVLMPAKGYGWLRWYDPYILRVLLDKGDTNLRYAFFGTCIQAFVVQNQHPEDYTCLVNPFSTPQAAPERIQISPDMIEHLNDAHYAFFLSELFKYCLRKYYPHLKELPESIKSNITAYCDTAQQHGLLEMGSMTRLVEIGIRSDWTCALLPEWQNLLASERTCSTELLQRLEKYVENTIYQKW